MNDSILNECVVSGINLKLNGTGIRKIFMVEVYRAYLHYVEPVSKRNQIMQHESPLRLSFQFTYGPISSDRMKQAWKDAFLKNMTLDEFNNETEVFESFMGTITKYQEADVVYYDIYKDTVTVYMNEELLVIINSSYLSDAIIDVVVGDHPIDECVKNGLLAA